MPFVLEDGDVVIDRRRGIKFSPVGWTDFVWSSPKYPNACAYPYRLAIRSLHHRFYIGAVTQARAIQDHDVRRTYRAVIAQYAIGHWGFAGPAHHFSMSVFDLEKLLCELLEMLFRKHPLLEKVGTLKSFEAYGELQKKADAAAVVGA